MGKPDDVLTQLKPQLYPIRIRVIQMTQKSSPFGESMGIVLIISHSLRLLPSPRLLPSRPTSKGLAQTLQVSPNCPSSQKIPYNHDHVSKKISSFTISRRGDLNISLVPKVFGTLGHHMYYGPDVMGICLVLGLVMTRCRPN